MANEQNLTHKLTTSDQRAGGKKSGEVRAAKKTIRAILSELLNGEISKASPQFAKLAAKLNITNDKSVKELFTLVCLMNSVKSGNLGDLEKLVGLLGETDSGEKNNGILDELAAWMKGGESNVE